MWDSLMAFLIEVQGSINARISADLSAFSQTRDWMALVNLLPMGILFGSVHALTPGHSKSILATYVAGSLLTKMQGMVVAWLLALTHDRVCRADLDPLYYIEPKLDEKVMRKERLQ